MNDAACGIFLNLIQLAVRMMPIFICLEPKVKNRGNIAAVSAYLWVIMVSAQSVFSLSNSVFFIWQGVFSCLFFLVLLVFFKGGAVKKAFLYISAWLFAILMTSLNEFAAWLLRGQVTFTYGQICVLVSFLSACGFGTAVWLWMKERVNSLFEQLSLRAGLFMLVYPCIFLVMLWVGTATIFSPGALAKRGLGDILFFLLLCVMILVLYSMILSTSLEILDRRRTQEELTFARQLIGKQREHYNQTLDYIEQVRIIKHDFRHHIHALLNMEKEDQERYLKHLQEELNQTEETVFCQNQSVNGLLQEYAVRARRRGIEFSAMLDLSVHIPIDDLTLCIVMGNLLENALEACSRLEKPGFIHLRARWMEDHLMMLVENSYNGQIHKQNGKILSSKKDGGLGMLSVRRILNRPGDEFEVDYNEATFIAMVKIVDRTLVDGSFPGGGFVL